MVKGEDTDLNQISDTISDKHELFKEDQLNEKSINLCEEEGQSKTKVSFKEEEDIAVKVIEYEIPIVGIKTESMEQSDGLSQVGISTSCDEPFSESFNVTSPKRMVSEESEQISPDGKSQITSTTAQPKRGGIVIKMKKVTLSCCPPSPNLSSTEICTSEFGNVLANRDSAVGENEPISVESRPEHISTSNCDNKGNDMADLTNDATAINGLAGDIAISVSEPATEPTVTDGEVLAGQDQAIRPQTEDQEQAKQSNHSDIMAQSETEQQQTSMNGPASAELQSPPRQDSSEADNVSNLTSSSTIAKLDVEEASYYSRGHEISSLCTIM